MNALTRHRSIVTREHPFVNPAGRPLSVTVAVQPRVLAGVLAGLRHLMTLRRSGPGASGLPARAGDGQGSREPLLYAGLS